MDIRIAVLERAAELEGGRERLARKLHTPARFIDYWMSGTTVPMDVFLAAWDVIFEHELESMNELHSHRSK